MKPRIIVCGLDRTGYKIFCLLRQQGAFVVGVNDGPIPGEADVIVGNLQAAATLRSAGIESAKTLVLAGADDTLNLAILMQARVLNPRIRIINRLFNTSLGDRLDQTLPEHVTMSVAALAAPVFAFDALGNQAIGQLQLFNQTWPLQEEYIDEAHPWKGRSLRDLWDDRSRMLIYYLPVDSRIDLVSAVIHGHALQPGDRLIIGTKPSVHSTHKSLIRRMIKVLTNLRQFQQHGKPVVVMALVLMVTVFIATLTYICAELNTSVVDALYFSVGMITGAGGDDKVVAQASDSIKLFTVVMMLIGAAVIVLLYALLNDFVLGSRFTQFWDAARVPRLQHYIVCGLGSIGMEIARQLHTSGHEVVIIERDPNNRFLNTARRLGIPIIQGDATLPATFQAANLCQTIHGWKLLDTCLSDGDVLYLTMPATGLEQLWRAAPSQVMAS